MPEPVDTAEALASLNDSPANGQPQFSGPEFWASVERSLIQAAKHAHLEAYLAGQGVAYDRDGVFGIYKPDPALYEELVPPDLDRSLVPPPFEDEETFPDEPQSLPQEYLDKLAARARGD